MTQVGVDIVARARDETAAGLNSVTRRMESFGAGTAAKGGDIGRRFSSNFTGAIVGGLAAIGIDKAIEGVIDARSSGKSIGMALAEGIAEGLRAIPVAGALGGLLASFDVFGMMPHRMSPEDVEARERTIRAQEAQQRARRLLEQIDDDKRSAAERRRRSLDEQLAPVLRDLPAGDRERVREDMRRSIEDREARDRSREEAKKRAEDELRRQRETVKRRQDLLGDAERRLGTFESASSVLPRLVESRAGTGRAAAFQATQDQSLQSLRELVDLMRKQLDIEKRRLEMLQESPLEVVS